MYWCCVVFPNNPTLGIVDDGNSCFLAQQHSNSWWFQWFQWRNIGDLFSKHVANYGHKNACTFCDENIVILHTTTSRWIAHKHVRKIDKHRWTNDQYVVRNAVFFVQRHQVVRTQDAVITQVLLLLWSMVRTSHKLSKFSSTNAITIPLPWCAIHERYELTSR